MLAQGCWVLCVSVLQTKVLDYNDLLRLMQIAATKLFLLTKNLFHLSQIEPVTIRNTYP
jgi:hypothetical protein